MRISYRLIVKALVPLTGAWEDGCTVEQVEKQAVDSVSHWRFFVAKSATGPTDLDPVAVEVGLESILLEPNDPPVRGEIVKPVEPEDNRTVVVFVKDLERLLDSVDDDILDEEDGPAFERLVQALRKAKAVRPRRGVRAR